MFKKTTRIALAIGFGTVIAFPASFAMGAEQQAAQAEQHSTASDTKTAREEKIKKLAECQTQSEAARKAYREAIKNNLAKRNEAYKAARIAREAAIKAARESYRTMAGMKQAMIKDAEGKEAKEAARKGFSAWQKDGLKERSAAIDKAVADYRAAVKAAQEAYLAANKTAREVRSAALTAAHKPCVLGAETGSVLGVFTSLLAVETGTATTPPADKTLDERKALEIERAEKAQKSKEEREAKREEAKAKLEAAKAKRAALKACNEAAQKVFKEAVVKARETHKEAVKKARESYKAMASQKEAMIKDAEGKEAKEAARKGFSAWQKDGVKERTEAVKAADQALKDSLKAANDARKAALAACKAANTTTTQ